MGKDGTNLFNRSADFGMCFDWIANCQKPGKKENNVEMDIITDQDLNEKRTSFKLVFIKEASMSFLEIWSLLCSYKTLLSVSLVFLHYGVLKQILPCGGICSEELVQQLFDA